MGDERGDDEPDRRRADVYSSARIGAAAALTLVLIVLLVLDVDADLRHQHGDPPARSLGPHHRAADHAGRAEGWLAVPSHGPG
jgi:hypothetical protein